MFNKKGLFILLCFFALLSIIFIAYTFNKNKGVISKKTPVPSVPVQVDFSQIVPGVSTKEEVFSILGKPLKEKESVLEYKSSSPNYNHEIGLDRNKVSFIKEIITLREKKNAKEIKNIYGVSKIMLYGPDAEAGFFLFVYPENGIAYIGHIESGLLLEIWYFPPTDLKNFIGKYGQDYSETRQIRQ